MNKFRSIFLILCALTLTGCNAVLLDPKGPIGAYEKHLMFMALGLMFIVVIPTILAVFIIARRYRASNKKAKYAPEFGHSVWLELFWWSVPIIIIIILATITWKTTHELDPYQKLTVAPKEAAYKPYLQNYLPTNLQGNTASQAPIEIDVIALPWRWLFIYPAQGMATINDLEFPVNTPIDFKITSDGRCVMTDNGCGREGTPLLDAKGQPILGHEAPMNSFQIPQLGGQIYAMAGMQTKLHLLANEEGYYDGRSVSFSGSGFSGMKFMVHVVSQKDFNQWVNTVKSKGTPLSWATYQRLSQEPLGAGEAKPVYLENPKPCITLPKEFESVDTGCFTSPAPDLFDTAINNFMLMSAHS